MPTAQAATIPVEMGTRKPLTLIIHHMGGSFWLTCLGEMFYFSPPAPWST